MKLCNNKTVSGYPSKNFCPFLPYFLFRVEWISIIIIITPTFSCFAFQAFTATAPNKITFSSSSSFFHTSSSTFTNSIFNPIPVLYFKWGTILLPKHLNSSALLLLYHDSNTHPPYLINTTQHNTNYSLFLHQFMPPYF